MVENKAIDSVLPNEKRSLGMETVSRFVKGGLSGFISGALLQPLQVIKTSMQVKPIDA
jgi:hypothetical protein